MSTAPSSNYTLECVEGSELVAKSYNVGVAMKAREVCLIFNLNRKKESS